MDSTIQQSQELFSGGVLSHVSKHKKKHFFLLDWKPNKITRLGVSFHAMHLVANQGSCDTHIGKRKKSVHILLGGYHKNNHYRRCVHEAIITETGL
jgi:hypothetical protein